MTNPLTKTYHHMLQAVVPEYAEATGLMYINGIEADFKLHSDIQIGHNTARQHTLTALPVEHKKWVEALVEWVEENYEIQGANGAWIYRGDLLTLLHEHLADIETKD